MTRDLFEKFDIVKSDVDREAALKELREQAPPIAAVTDDDQTFIMKLERVQERFLLMTPLENPRPIKLNEPAYLIFSLSSGQFSMRGPLMPTKEGIVVFSFDVQLRRLQRRNNFRVPIVGTQKVHFHLLQIDGKKNTTVIEMLDLSAGGMALGLTHPNQELLKAQFEVQGHIVHPSRRIENLNAVVCHTTKLGDQLSRAGLQFKNVSPAQQQDLLALSLQVHREASYKTKL